VKKIKRLPDIFILSAVILSVVYFILNDCSRIIHWNVFWKNILLAAGFFLDTVFSIDFVIRIYRSRKRKGILNYIKDENGWSDFISSLVPFSIHSFPSLILILYGHADTAGASGFFTSIITMRAADTLRFFRIIKLFTLVRIHDSEMTVHHISLINTLLVSSIITVFLIFSIAPGNSYNRLLKERSVDYINFIDGLKRISDMNGIGYREVSESMLLADKNILRIIYANGTVMEKSPDPVFRREYNSADYIHVKGRACTVMVSIRDINRIAAVDHIQFLMIIICTVMSILFIYSGHFARNISDVITILNQGFRKKDYNLLVKVPERYKDHEVFRLSKFYNDAYLPAKMKKIMDRER